MSHLGIAFYAQLTKKMKKNSEGDIFGETSDTLRNPGIQEPAKRTVHVTVQLGIPAHICSEQSLRILMWNASDVQKHQQLNDTKNDK